MRCFIAIELSEDIHAILVEAQAALKPAIRGDIKWVEPENIHLTLKFLGDIVDETSEKIKRIIPEIAAKTRPFIIGLSKAGAFPSPDRPSVIWIGIDKGEDELTQLAANIEGELEGLGIDRESRPFHPHLTIARVKFLRDKRRVKGILESLKIRPVEMALSKITLFQSALTNAGPIYTKLSESVIG